MHDAFAVTESRIWWGSYRLEPPQCGRWRIGPLTLWVERLHGEWRLAYDMTEDPLDPEVEVELPATVPDLLRHENAIRYGLVGDDPCFHVTPMLPDRPTVTKPERPFVVLPGESLVVHVSTVLWLQFEAGEQRRRLTELPIFRPSDTWFGDSTLEGQLCYASHAFCRLRLEELSRTPYRATTAVTLHNRSREPLRLERLKLPCELLSLYHAPDGGLWTEDVSVTRSGADNYAQVRLQKRAWKRTPVDARRLAGPRKRVEPKGLAAMFGSWLE